MNETRGPRRGLPTPKWLRTTVVVLGLSTLVAGGGLREDELDCEQAVAHLQECCPDFAGAQIQCVFDDTCDLTEPALSIDESHCIQQLSCADVQARDLCAKTKDLQSPGEDADGNPITHAPVCP